MARTIKINCKKVYDVGTSYTNSANRLKEIQKEMKDIASSVSNIWQGVDSSNFNVMFNEHIKALDNLVIFLENKSELLKKNALNHNMADDDFSTKMKRSDQDERFS